MSSFPPSSNSTPITSRHLARRPDGVPCMVVLDPATRKLLIPCCSIFPTRAQRRATIPSLCQLFLLGRCRQGAECHQVHAGPGAVAALRGRVGCLPRCCPLHGDMDHADVMNERSWASRVVLYIPAINYEEVDEDVDGEGGCYYIPLRRVSYTAALRRLLKERPDRVMSSPTEEEGQDGGGGADAYEDNINNDNNINIINKIDFQREDPRMMILDASDQVICRLHIFDRCRYAEDCRFLHLCKEITASLASSSSSMTLQGNGPETQNFVPKGQQGTSVFASISRQQQLRGYPLHCSAPDSFVNNGIGNNNNNTPSEFWPMMPQNNNNNNYNSSSSYNSNWGAQAVSSYPMYSPLQPPQQIHQRIDPARILVPLAPTPYTPDESFSASVAEGSIRSLSIADNSFNTIPSAVLKNNNDNNIVTDVGDSLLTPSTCMRRHWQHNPYGAARLLHGEDTSIL